MFPQPAAKPKGFQDKLGPLFTRQKQAKDSEITATYWEDLEAGIGIEPIYMDLQSSA
jgi:hypothetical protein